jgi:phage terminase large subunit-like protein
MRLLDWFRRNATTPTPIDPMATDVGLILSDGLRDRDTAIDAIARLKDVRTALAREERAADKARLTPGQMRRMVRASGGGPLGAYQYGQEMRQRDEAGMQRAAELAAIDEQRQAIDRAIMQLEGVKRGRT